MAANLKNSFGIIVLCVVIGALHAQTIPGISGIDQGVFRYHFEKADRETDPAAWMEQARLGRELALGSWERTAFELYGDPVLREEAAGDLARWSQEELERRFAQWLLKRFTGERSIDMAQALLKAADKANRTYAYHTDGDGNIVYSEDSLSPEPVRPSEGRDAEIDRVSWHGIVSEAGETELGSYAQTLAAHFPELLFYVPEQSRGEFQASLGSVYQKALSARESEFRALLAREERLFIARRTGDIWSLRRQSENESASAITARLVQQADALCEEALASLKARVESARSGSGDLVLAGSQWFDEFREQFEKGLNAWETAEEAFLIRRMEWERDSGEYFLAGQDAWQNAFSEFENERLSWEQRAAELFRTGEQLFSGVSEQLNCAIAEARAQFEADSESRINNGVERARSWVDMYITCASVLVEARENVSFWLGRFTTDAPPSLDGGTLSAWANGILGSGRPLSADQKMAGQELVRWSDLYIQYRNKAAEAKTTLENEFALALGNNAGGLADVLNADSGDFHLDEYQVEILRAQAVAGYWEQRLVIAEAVSAYAEELTAGRYTEAESVAEWRNAKAAYDAALASYSAIQEQLGAANASIAEIQEEMRGVSIALDNAERRLEELNGRYALQMAAYQINSRDFILEELGSCYAELIEQREKREQNSAYYTAYLKASRDYSDASGLAESWEKLESIVSESESGEVRAMKLALLGTESAADWYFAFSGKDPSDDERDRLADEGLFARLEQDAESGGETAALMLQVYRELAPMSPAARKEAALSALNGMNRVFRDYGIESAGGDLPSTEAAGKAIFTYADERGIDCEKAAAEFFLSIDKELMFVPAWIEQETASWKSAAIAYMAAHAAYLEKTPAESAAVVFASYQETEKKLEAVYMYDLYLSLGMIPDFEKPEDDYAALAAEAGYYRYVHEYLAAYENSLGVRELPADVPAHWKTYIPGGGFSQAEGLLADALDNAEQARKKLEHAFDLFLESPSSPSQILFMETSNRYLQDHELGWEKLFDDNTVAVTGEFYESALEKLRESEAKEAWLKAEISRLGLGYSILPPGGLEAREELEKISAELEQLRLYHQSAFAGYATLADAFSAAGSQYESVYGEAKRLFAAMEKTRVEYEKQDAIRRWAATAYLYAGSQEGQSGQDILFEAAYYKEPREELVYARERNERAKIALKALQDMYKNGEETRPYNDDEYNRLYAEYQAGFNRMFLALKAKTEMDAALASEKNNSAFLYSSLSAQASSYINPALVEFFSDPEKTSENPWFDYLRVGENGLLSLDYDPETFALSSFEKEQFRDYFEAGSYSSGTQEKTSAFESAVSEWSIRMASYDLGNMENFSRWGLALDYLISNLVGNNPDIEGIAGAYTLTNLGENGAVELDGERLDSILNRFRGGKLPDAQSSGYNSLTDSEKADLEFFAALLLSGGGGAGASGLTRFSEYHELQWLYHEADYYRIEKKVLWFTIVICRWPYFFPGGVDKVNYVRNIASGQAGQIYNMINSEHNEYIESMANLSRTVLEYQASCEKLETLQGFKESGVTEWNDIENALAVSAVFSGGEIAAAKTYWDEMLAYYGRQGEVPEFTDTAAALEALMTWSGGMWNGIQEQFETVYAAGEARRRGAQAEYRTILSAYIEGEKTREELDAAAREAYGDKAPAIKNHLENLGSTILSNLEGMSTEKSGYALKFRELAAEYEQLVGRIYKSRFDAELASREAEWENRREDLDQKRASWKEASGLILERGREDWKTGFEKITGQYEKWTAAFEEDYTRIGAAWDAAYLESLEDKDIWIGRAVDAADNALQGALLSFVGSEAEAGSRKLAAFFPSTVPGYGGADEAKKAMRDVLAAAGIAGLSGAFDAVNGNAGTAGIALRAGNSGMGLWDTGRVRAAARELAQTGTAELASRKMKILAFQARESALAAKKELDQNVGGANRNFDKSMDEMFTQGAGWLRSGSRYLRDIIVHSTLFQPVITDSVNIESYKWYVMDYWELATDLSESSLEGIDYLGVQALVGLAQDEVRQKSKTVFGDGSGQNGFLSVWIGEAPEMINGTFSKQGSGELGRLLREFYTYSLKQSTGIALANAPFWEKPVWDSRGSWFSAPSIRSIADIAMTAVSAAAVAASPLTGGASLVLGVAVNMADDALFTGLDVWSGYKSWDEAGFAFGQKALISAVSAAAGAVFNGVGGYVDRVVDSGFGKVMANSALAGAQAFSTGTITGALSSVTYSRENGFGFSAESLRSGLRGSLTGAVSSGMGSLVSGSLNLGLDGFFQQYRANGEALSSLIGGFSEQGLNYALGGDITLNAFNLGAIKGMPSLGLLELHLGGNGFSANFGSGGTDISVGKISQAASGLEAWKVNFGIWNGDSVDAKRYISQMRSLYSGDAVNKNEYESILAGTTKILENRSVEETRSEYVSENGTKYIILGSGALDDTSRFGLNVVFSHESYRNGIDDGGDDQQFETTQAVMGHISTALGLMQSYGTSSVGAAMAGEAESYYANYTTLMNGNSSSEDKIKAFQALGALFDGYDSSGDYWKLKMYDNGTHEIVNDNKKELSVDYYAGDSVISTAIPEGQDFS
ncbi:MAG: hypothetical protein LBI67_03410, partial [Treponema sp.]|nr:hypothetical protein [Treponema sp.]